ncbi:four-helix bundle copper-binding protein [Pseudalkalibacillus sp. Hm43]|uniref:four-helix bundle copper-binding protein n=1 Tax=Pseudalkalibacillus sp. Hm43 TaxID=3450742 RepID=UPI003F4412E9
MAKESDQNLIELCMECRDLCEDWLKRSNIQSSDESIDECSRLILECYDICAYTALTLQRETPFSKEVCQLCELICEACGNECKSHPISSEYNLTEICYEVAERCRQRLY